MATMESPRPYNESIIDFDDGPPSSPFMTETESRIGSKALDIPVEDAAQDDLTMDLFATPAKPMAASVRETVMMGEDKENEPQSESPTQKLVSPQKPQTPDHKSKLPPMSEARRGSDDSDLMPPPPPSVRKVQTPKRSPLKQSRSAANAQTPRSALRRNDSFEHTEVTRASRKSQETVDFRSNSIEEVSGLDDTGFSAFSEVPDLTTWAKLGQSPARRGMHTPSRQSEATPRAATNRKRRSSSRSPSPTPRRTKTPATRTRGHSHSVSHDGTTFLIDFTQQMDDITAGAYSRRASPAKSTTQPDLLKYMNDQRSPHKGMRPSYSTPAKQQSNIMNLLDFELPPAPTPRSIPTITVRELESLKSSYLSQISSLKATLSGREAEVESLKRAVGDAERRVGEAQESLREEKNRREYAEQEKAGWEKRGQEVENLLAQVKEEVLKSEAEKEDLMRKMEDSDRRADEAEARALKAEERFADSLAARAAALHAPSSDGSTPDAAASDTEARIQRLVAAQIDSKIEAVSRELHAVYKEKHERKVSTLKKSYEARSEKKCADLQHRLAELEKVHEDLLASKEDEATFSGPVPVPVSVSPADAQLKADLEAQRARFARLDAEFQASRKHQAQLERELAQERIEKGDLVAAVDEMLALQSEQGPAAQGAMSVVEDFRKSIGRPPAASSSSSSSSGGSGLRVPGSGNGNGGLGAGMTNGGGGGGGGSKIGGMRSSGLVKGGMMGRIERMGRSGGGGGGAAGQD
jgi:hypothetical protein